MNLFDDTYKTIDSTAAGVFRDKGSRSIAHAFPLRNEEELKDKLNDIKSLHPKARHHCYAYRLTTDRSVFRFNDDGEPAGTAERPILNTLLSNELTDILIIVVRYFGGTLLGIPGLINAYKTAAQEAINQCVVVEKYEKDVYEITCDYLAMNDVMRIVKNEELELLEQHFD